MWHVKDRIRVNLIDVKSLCGPRAAKLFLQIVLTNPISKYAEVGLPNKKVTTGYLFPAVDDFRFDPLINMIGTNLSGIAFDRRAFFPHKNPASHLSFFPSPPIPFLLLVFTFYHTRASVRKCFIPPRAPPPFFSVTRRGYTAYFSCRPFPPPSSLDRAFLLDPLSFRFRK